MMNWLFAIWLVLQSAQPIPVYPEPYEDTILSDQTMECMPHECGWMEEVEPNDI